MGSATSLRERADIGGAVDALLAGDETQWPLVVLEVHGWALGLCARRQNRLGSDFASNVALRAVERLKADDYQALRRFVENRRDYPQLEFQRWTGGIINNALIDELRSLPSVSRSRDDVGRTLVRREHVAFTDDEHSTDQRSKQRAQLDVRRILRWLHDEAFPADQRQALVLWLHGYSISDCANKLSLSEEQARRMLRAARRRLRRKFEESE